MKIFTLEDNEAMQINLDKQIATLANPPILPLL